MPVQYSRAVILAGSKTCGRPPPRATPFSFIFLLLSLACSIIKSPRPRHVLLPSHRLTSRHTPLRTLLPLRPSRFLLLVGSNTSRRSRINLPERLEQCIIIKFPNLVQLHDWLIGRTFDAYYCWHSRHYYYHLYLNDDKFWSDGSDWLRGESREAFVSDDCACEFGCC